MLGGAYLEICDFSLVMRIIKDYISDSRGISQTDLLYEVFATFMEDKENTDYDFDNALVCRWMNGQGAISPKISKYYQEKDMEAAMAQGHGNDSEAFEYEKRASELITSVNNENAHLYSNVLSNHGMMYFSRGNLEKAKQHIEEGIRILKKYNLMYVHDTISLACNFAMLKAATGDINEGMRVLRETEKTCGRSVFRLCPY